LPARLELVLLRNRHTAVALVVFLAPTIALCQATPTEPVPQESERAETQTQTQTQTQIQPLPVPPRPTPTLAVTQKSVPEAPSSANDRSTDEFNISEIGGNASEAALSNLYYPASERGFGKTAKNFATQMIITATANILKEFWPDIRKNVFRIKGDEFSPRHEAGMAPSMGAPSPLFCVLKMTTCTPRFEWSNHDFSNSEPSGNRYHTD
jgi:hypothetical protein